MHRQIRRHSTRRSTSSSSRRRLGQLWSRVFNGGGRARGHVSLLDSSGPTQVTLGLHSYRSVVEQGSQAGGAAWSGHEVDATGRTNPCCPATMNLQACTPESPVSPLSSQSDSPEEQQVSGSRAPTSEPPAPCQSDSSTHSGLPHTPQEASVSHSHPRASRKLVLELAVNLKGVSLRRYSPLGPLSPISPLVFPSSSQTPTSHPYPLCPEGTSPTESLSSVKTEDSDSHITVPSRERKRRNERRREGKSRFCRVSRALSDEGGDSGRETTPC